MHGKQIGVNRLSGPLMALSYALALGLALFGVVGCMAEDPYAEGTLDDSGDDENKDVPQLIVDEDTDDPAAVGAEMVLPGTATEALAANPTRRCQEPPNQPLLFMSCQLLFSGFPGGTISIDVDADGTGNGTWILLQHGAWRACEVHYDLRAPAQSWVCHNLPADNYVLINYGEVSTTFHQLGARW